MQEKSAVKYGIWIAVGCGALFFFIICIAAGGYFVWRSVPSATNSNSSSREPISSSRPEPQKDTGTINYPAPSEFQKVNHAGSGEIWIAQLSGSSARSALMQTLAKFSAYYDSRPVVIQGFIDAQDHAAQALLACAKTRESYRALVRIDSVNGRLTVFWLTDQTSAFDESLQGLSQAALNSFPRERKQNIQWYQAALPDGSGTVQLPQGWAIGSASQGMVSIAGPSGQVVDLGVYYRVYTPEAAANLYVRPTLVAPASDPVTAFQNMTQQLSAYAQQQSGGPAARVEQIVETTPVQNPNGAAAYIHYLASAGNQQIEGLTMVAVSPVGDGSWIYYSSGCGSPRNSFRQNFPVMWEIWSHWKVADHVYRERMNQALQSMREAYSIYQQAQSNSMEVSSDANAKWSEYIRETRQVQDGQDGTVHETSAQGVEDLMDSLNRSEGYERWKILPIEDLNRH